MSTLEAQAQKMRREFFDSIGKPAKSWWLADEQERKVWRIIANGGFLHEDIQQGRLSNRGGVPSVLVRNPTTPHGF